MTSFVKWNGWNPSVLKVTFPELRTQDAREEQKPFQLTDTDFSHDWNCWRYLQTGMVPKPVLKCPLHEDDSSSTPFPK